MDICACIMEKTTTDCLRILNSIDTGYIEHRMDMMESIVGLEEIYCEATSNIIATNRSTKCGGYFHGDDKDRIEYLIKAIDAGCDHVDIELETEATLRDKVIEHARKKGCKVILSHHDFEATPTSKELEILMEREFELGADIGKIVTFAKEPGDCHRILELLLKAKVRGYVLTAFAMGREGTYTRVLAPVYGAPFTYASVNRSAAEGQLDVDTLREIWRLLGIE